MRIGVPKEIKNNEFRVGLTPNSVAELIDHGHEVLVETNAGLGSGLSDEEYVAAGAKIVATPDEIFARRGDDRKGEGAARRGAQETAAWPGAVHLSASRARSSPDRGSHRVRRDLHRLRDRDGADGRPAAADPDVGGRGPARAASRRACAREGAGRARRAARRRARRSRCGSRHHRRRRFGNACGEDCARHGRQRHRRRQVERSAQAHRR